MQQFAPATGRKSPVDYVNPNIGGIGRLLKATLPGVYLPHGMVSVAPITPPLIVDRYLADKILGFPAGGAVLTPTSGPLETDHEKTASVYDHDMETSTPYFYSVWLEDWEIGVDYTVSERAIHYRFAFPESGAARLLFRGRDATSVQITGASSLEGGQPGPRGGQIYFAAEFSQPFARDIAGDPLMVLDFKPGAHVGMRVGVSHISTEQARKNLAKEIPDWDFDATRAKARAAWESALGRISVKGGTEEERTIFYTSLYRALQRMIDVTEDGNYAGFDGKIHSAGGHAYHTNDWIWDTYRAMHPLQLLLDPQRQEHMIQSYIRMYEQSGWLPRFPGLGADSAGMIGHHAAALVADTYFKGHRNFDIEKAYEGIRKNAMEATLLPFRKGPATPLDTVYREQGFFPALAEGEAETIPEVHPFERRQAVSVTLEACYDDWCVAQLARALGKDDDYEYFMKRAANYRNVFDVRAGFMAPRSADGNWVSGFDPIWGGGQGGRAWFTECNSWTYTWHVQHDIAGLVQLMGGRRNFLSKLDALFVEPFGTDRSKYEYLAQFPDMTCLIGQFAQGNEPGFHIPYLYCYAGEPWKTQRRIRETMKLWFNDGPEGIPGDEDGGAMCSWYVMSAMGFYPVCPGSPCYVIGSPIFEEIRITRTDGKVFTVTARDVSGKNKFIQSAELNGEPLDKPWFRHSDLIPGGSLVLQMGPRPNKSWGSDPKSAPPSMSDE